MAFSEILSRVTNLVSRKNIDAALSGASILDPVGVFTERDIETVERRLSRYRAFRDAYDGRGLTAHNDDGDIEIAANMNRTIVDKSVDWLFGRPFKVIADAGNEAMAEAVTRILADEDIHYKSMCVGQVGSITGDGYFYIYMEENTGRIRINFLKSMYVHPVFHPVDQTRLTGALVQFPLDVSPIQARRYSVPPGQKIYTQYITDDVIVEYMDSSKISESPNPFGEIPIFHAPNLLHGFRWFGMSDLEDVYLVTKIRNEAINSLKRIIEYQGEPTTVLIGASAKNLEKNARALWSIKNKDAKVQTLSLDTDLAATVNYISMLKSTILELSSVPEHSLGSSEVVNNVSAAALEVRYLCLLEKTRKKRITYGMALSRMCKLIAQVIASSDPSIFAKLEKPELFDNLKISFPSPLPRDMKTILEEEEIKLRMQLQSKHGALKEILDSGVEERAVEIIADRTEEMLTDIEKARASEGGVPNLLAPSTGSLGMHISNREDLMKRQEQVIGIIENTLKNSQSVTSEGEMMPEEVAINAS